MTQEVDEVLRSLSPEESAENDGSNPFPHHHVQWVGISGGGERSNSSNDSGTRGSNVNDGDTKKTTGTDEGSMSNTSTPRRPSPKQKQKNTIDDNTRPESFDPRFSDLPSAVGAAREGGPHFSLLTGMRKDLRARIPLYLGDWKRPDSFFKVLNATVFAFVVQLIPALIFAELLDKTTEGSLSVTETLLSAGIIGIIYAVLSGQPLVLVGITGPVAILLGNSYRLADQFQSEYWPFFWWLCIWTSILHLVTAMIGLVDVVWTITPFTTQIFEFFIASTFIFESIRDLFEPLQLSQSTSSLLFDAPDDKTSNDDTMQGQLLMGSNINYSSSMQRSAAYAGLVIGIGTFYLCWVLHFADTWLSFNNSFRTFLSSYNMAISLVIMTGLSYVPGIDQSVAYVQSDGRMETLGGIERVHVAVPWDWQPTVDRSWVVNPLVGISTEGIFGALFPAVMLYLLFFIDHNISSILTQSPKYNLTKPPAYHWDFFILGLTILPCGILGLPPGSGLIPQAPLHTRALCTRKYETLHGRQHEIFVDCEEQRWSALFQAVLMFAALGSMRVISWIPVGCLFGIFLYLGVGAMHGNEIWERITLIVVGRESRPQIPVVKHVKQWKTVVAYTTIQVALAAVTFSIAQFVSWGYVFPALIAGFVPIRSFLIVRLFDETDLKYLDPIHETDDDYIAELIEYEESQKPRHVSEFGLGLSEFRIGNVPHDPDEYYERHPEYQVSERSFGSNHSLRSSPF
ncbi:unnamed protein product [Pseudo-nitzschia multistriata]|uniref:Bicarbonate transporter-like transmembrane domain-containing protein n=1 Tax=Pseudo-nitzschia multistriata TaxID=183589 RepID=A0A448ZG45_9STRA|nr:unnamed protein product [Pseudo-nitzschia multistriata]